MLTDSEINSTQLAGLLAFGIASWAAFRASGMARAETLKVATLWRWVGVVQLLFFLEVVFSTRHLAHDYVNQSLHAMGSYQERASIQETLLIGVGVCGVVMITVLCRWLSGNRPLVDPTNAALFMTVTVLFLFVVETISLHAIDRVLYRPVGPVLLIAYLWLATSLGVVISARRLQCANSERKPAG